MTSAIDNTFLTSINENYPVAGVNNSSQGFRDNFSQIKQGLQIAGKELTYLQGKQIEVIGDATGISGVLGNSLVQPTPISLTLASTGVVAGTYDTTANTLSFTVDEKGRLTQVLLTPIATRPGVVGTFETTVTTNTDGFVTSISTPSFEVDEYGTITAAANAAGMFDFGITGHPLTQGSLLVGDENGVAREFPVPGISYNANDIYALAWRPEPGNSQALAWVKIPESPPVNPAQLISVQAGEGIHVDTNATDPTISLDITGYPEYPEIEPITPTSKILYRDSVTNSNYLLDISRIFEAQPVGSTPLFALKDDTAPELGGILDVGFHRIRGMNTSNGIVLETHDTGKVRIATTSTVDLTTDPPSTKDPADWVTVYQSLPAYPPTFTPEQIEEGITSAVLRSRADGIWYWSPQPDTSTSVTEITRGPGLRFSPAVDTITSTGTIEVNFMEEPSQEPDIYSDYAGLMDYAQILYKTTLDKLTWTLPQIRVVDPINGDDDPDIPNVGHLHRPYATINTAIAQIDPLSVDDNVILLMPGIYDEAYFTINRPNVQIISLMGPKFTRINGSVVIDPNDDNYPDPIELGRIVLKGIDFHIDTIMEDVPDRIITAEYGLGSLFVEDCWFYQSPDDDDRLQEIIRLEGTQVGDVQFENCKFNGIFVNGLILDNTDNLYDGTVRITNTKGDRKNQLQLVTENGSRTVVENATIMRHVKHNGGRLELNNILSIRGEWSDADWAAAQLANDHPINLGYLPDAITSTANSSTSPWNVLLVRNISTRYLYPGSLYMTSRLNKTGTCDYSIANAERRPEIDVLTGTQIDSHSTAQTDVVNNVATASISGTYTIDVTKASTFDLTLTGNTTITLSAPTLNSNPFVAMSNSHVVRVLMRQDGTGSRTWNFTGVTWDGGSAPSLSSSANAKAILEFSYISGDWYGRTLVS